MADTRTDNGSPERVALELAEKIAGWESAKSNDLYSRTAFLDLYAECRRATVGTRSAKPAT